MHTLYALCFHRAMIPFFITRISLYVCVNNLSLQQNAIYSVYLFIQLQMFVCRMKRVWRTHIHIQAWQYVINFSHSVSMKMNEKNYYIKSIYSLFSLLHAHRKIFKYFIYRMMKDWKFAKQILTMKVRQKGTIIATVYIE